VALCQRCSAHRVLACAAIGDVGFQQPCGFAVQPYSQPKAPILLSMTTTALVQAGNPIRRRSVWRPWLLGWLGIIPLAILNGTLRELVYKDRVGPMAGHYISTLVLISLVSIYLHFLDRRWPIPTRRIAVEMGGTWLALTVLFEFGFGHYVDGASWERLLEQYDVTRGYIWIMVLIWARVGPLVARELHSTRKLRMRLT
jgi:hypothetical protein